MNGAAAPNPLSRHQRPAAPAACPAEAALGERLVGLYLFGPLALGDFDPASSDVGFIALTVDELEEDGDIARLSGLRAELAAHGGAWGERVEGAVLFRSTLWRYDPTRQQLSFSAHTPPQMTVTGQDWLINRAVLRAHGVVVCRAGQLAAQLHASVAGALDALITVVYN